MNWKKSVVCLLLVLFLIDVSMAWPRRRRGSDSVAAFGQVYDNQYQKLPNSAAIYDWDEIAKIDAVDYIPIVLSEPLSGKIEVKLTCLNNSKEVYTIEATLKDGRADIRHKAIQPGQMYCLSAAIDGKKRLVGPYFTATSGKSAEARGRRQIIIRYFEQYWLKENGYDYYNANCEMGYRWAIQPYASLPDYDYTGMDLKELAEKGMIHGDKCSSASHTWMALAYDQHTGNIWCIDSNFNHTIMVIQRQPGGWSVGHLQPAHFQRERVVVATLASSR